MKRAIPPIVAAALLLAACRSTARVPAEPRMTDPRPAAPAPVASVTHAMADDSIPDVRFLRQFSR